MQQVGSQTWPCASLPSNLLEIRGEVAGVMASNALNMETKVIGDVGRGQGFEGNGKATDDLRACCFLFCPGPQLRRFANTLCTDYGLGFAESQWALFSNSGNKQVVLCSLVISETV